MSLSENANRSPYGGIIVMLITAAYALWKWVSGR